MTKALEKTTAPLNAVPAFSREQIELLKRTTCKGATDDELQLFLALCRRTGLDPFARQIYAIKRWDSREKREVLQTQTSIDGLRLIADRSGKYEGQEGPYWCGADGAWRDVWLSDEPPVAAKVGVLKQNCRAPFWGVARYQEYCQTDRSGSPNGMWRNMPANQLAKCCEALALRKAFPQELSGLYGSDELDHTENGAEPVRAEPTPQKPWSNFGGMITEFAKLHGRLPQDQDHVYRDTLRKYGVEHSNQFKNVDKAIAAYAELLAIVQTLEDPATAVPPEPEEIMTSLQPLWQIEDELAALLDSVDTCPDELREELEQRIAAVHRLRGREGRQGQRRADHAGPHRRQRQGRNRPPVRAQAGRPARRGAVVGLRAASAAQARRQAFEGPQRDIQHTQVGGAHHHRCERRAG